MKPPSIARRSLRMKHPQNVQFALPGGRSSGIVLNQSHTGIYIQSNRILKPGSLIRVRTYQGQPLVEGKVIWNRSRLGLTAGGMGIQICTASSEYSSTVENLLQTFESKEIRETPFTFRSLENIADVREVQMRGDLAQHSLPQVFGKLSVSKKTGKLFVQYENEFITFLFHKGRVASFDLNLLTLSKYISETNKSLFEEIKSDFSTVENIFVKALKSKKPIIEDLQRTIRMYFSKNLRLSLMQKSGMYEFIEEDIALAGYWEPLEVEWVFHEMLSKLYNVAHQEDFMKAFKNNYYVAIKNIDSNMLPEYFKVYQMFQTPTNLRNLSAELGATYKDLFPKVIFLLLFSKIDIQ